MLRYQIDDLLVAAQHRQMHRAAAVEVFRTCQAQPLRSRDILANVVDGAAPNRPMECLTRRFELLDGVQIAHHGRLIAFGGNLANGLMLLVLQIANVIVALQQQMLEKVDVTAGRVAHHVLVDLGRVVLLAGLERNVARRSIQFVAERDADTRIFNQLAERVGRMRTSAGKVQHTLAVFVLWVQSERL